MDGIYERYAQLRDSKGFKDADLVRGTGISKSTFSEWKRGRSVPKIDKLERIADFLGTTVHYLKTGIVADEKIYYLSPETADMAQKIFENKELRALFSAAKDSPAEDLKVAHDMLLALKRKERGE